MLDKINNQIKINSASKEKNFCYKGQDSVLKNKDEYAKDSNVEELNNFLNKIFKRGLFTEFAESLTEGSSWGGMNSVGFNYTSKWEIDSVAICSMNKELGEYTVKNVSIKDFLREVEKVKDELIKDSFEKKQEYDASFKKLQVKIAKDAAPNTLS